MRTLACFLLVWLSVATSPVLARSKNCVPDTGCPAGMGPPDCCQPPPCEFWNALEEARATERIVRTQRFMHSDPDKPETERNFESFSKEVLKQVRKIRKTLPKCKLKGKRKNPPIFSLDPENQDCRIMTYADKTFRDLELPDAQKLLDGCEEIVKAKYESAYVGSTYCSLQANSPAERMQERQERLRREMTVLEDQLFQYWRACTIAPDIEVPEIIVHNSVDVLKRFNFNRKWSAPPAKRAGK